jgi:hypothetical protein
MSEKEGRTCLTCAKAKIKCDKAHGGKCGRCARLGMECQAQLRGRGRPPNSALPAAAASAKPAASAKAAKHSKVVALDREPRARAPKFKSAQLVEEAYDESEVDEVREGVGVSQPSSSGTRAAPSSCFSHKLTFYLMCYRFH